MNETCQVLDGRDIDVHHCDSYTREATINMAYCDTIEMSHLALVETLVKALQGVGHVPTPTVSLPRFLGRPQSPSDPTIDQWLADFDVFVRQCGVPEEAASGGVGGLPWWVCEGGSAKSPG